MERQCQVWDLYEPTYDNRRTVDRPRICEASVQDPIRFVFTTTGSVQNDQIRDEADLAQRYL